LLAGRISVRSRLTSGTADTGESAARWRSDSSQRACSVAFSSPRMAGLTCPYTPRMPGSSWPGRSDLRTSGVADEARDTTASISLLTCPGEDLGLRDRSDRAPRPPCS
jgi:hypothetical protein